MQTEMIPVRLDDKALRLEDPAQAASIWQRVGRGSRPGLSPERALESMVDAYAELEKPKNARHYWRIQARLGFTGMLLGLGERAARKAGSAEKSLELLNEARHQYEKRGANAMRLATPLRPGWTLPKDGFAAVRFRVQGEDAALQKMMRVAAGTKKPIQLVVPDAKALSKVGALLSICRGGPVILSGLPDFYGELPTLESLLGKHRNMYFDTSARGHKAYARWFRDLSQDTKTWRPFIERYADRILLASGAAGGNKRMRWDQQPRVLRAIRWALERDFFHVPLLTEGAKGEWDGYAYMDEPAMPGLALDPAIVDAIAFGNFDRLFAGD